MGMWSKLIDSTESCLEWEEYLHGGSQMETPGDGEVEGMKQWDLKHMLLKMVMVGFSRNSYQ